VEDEIQTEREETGLSNTPLSYCVAELAPDSDSVAWLTQKALLKLFPVG
jgi:hypothetical protein